MFPTCRQRIAHTAGSFLMIRGMIHLEMSLTVDVYVYDKHELFQTYNVTAHMSIVAID